MSLETLSDFVEATAAKFGIPGVAVGVWADGQEIYASYGVTSIDNPLPVDQDTLFLVGSVTKTFTATTLMRLVADATTRYHLAAMTNHVVGVTGGQFAHEGHGNEMDRQPDVTTRRRGSRV